jgi:hypothetical protein
VRGAVVPVQWFGCLFQCQGHGDFSLPPLSVSLHKNWLRRNLQMVRGSRAPLILAQNLATRCFPRTCFLGLGSVGGESDLGAMLILLFGTAGHGNGADDVPALHDGERAAAGHDATATRDN